MSVVCNHCQHCPSYPHARDGSDGGHYSWSDNCAKHLRISAHTHVITNMIIITRDDPATTCRHYAQNDQPPSEPSRNRFQLILEDSTVPDDLR
jgi:hypothetical protein